jgi:hypothetical protein
MFNRFAITLFIMCVSNFDIIAWVEVAVGPTTGEEVDLPFFHPT